MGALFGTLKRRGFQRGVLGNDHRWLTVWAVLALAGFVRKRAQNPVVVERYELKPGQTIVIEDIGAPERSTRRTRRQARRSQRQRQA